VDGFVERPRRHRHRDGRSGCDLQLTEYAGENWPATFFVTDMANSIVKGSAYEPNPVAAVSRDALP
jgi:hypothetical protein